MELVEGETLAERIATGPIPLDEALPLFIQIADRKPKILDFGLAKAFVECWLSHYRDRRDTP